ncbi:unnamed protein product [Brassica oleracea]
MKTKFRAELQRNNEGPKEKQERNGGVVATSKPERKATSNLETHSAYSFQATHTSKPPQRNHNLGPASLFNIT